VTIAETVLGRGDQAFEYWKATAPAFREEISEIHRLEPYCYAQMIAGRDAPREGEAKNAWLSGTAAWNWVALTQHILGVRPELGGLRVEPCLPGSIGTLEVTRQCRGAEYRIKVKNQATGKAARLVVDGKPAEGTLVPWAPEGATVTVEVEV
jgi:cellobiose phosphorylase